MGNPLPRRTHLRPSQRIYTTRKILTVSAGVFSILAILLFVYLQFTQYEYAKANSNNDNKMELMQPEKEIPKVAIPFTEKYPVSLASFISEVNPITVELNWATAAENENDYFIVDRSNDGSQFTEIGEIQSVGSLSKSMKYSLLDKNPGNGVLIYRLKQVSKDGSSSFIAIEKTHRFNKNSDKPLYIEAVVPKNFNKYLNINYFALTEGGVAVEIFNKQGLNIYKAYTHAKRGFNTCRFIDGEMLTESEYTLRISNSTGAYVQKLKRDV